MAPDSDHTPANPDVRSPDPARDGSASPGFDEGALYVVVRDAVRDALLDVVGTLLLVGTAFVLVVAGGQVVISSTAPAGAAVGVVVAVAGLYLAAATLEIVPPLREWI